MLVIPSERQAAKAARVLYNDLHRVIRAEVPKDEDVEYERRREEEYDERSAELREMQGG